MPSKQQIHELVNAAPEGSPLLEEVYERLRREQAIGEAMEDIREGRTVCAEDFLAKVEARWPGVFGG